MRFLKELKKFFTKESFIVALVVLIISFIIQSYISDRNVENKILQIDEYNLGVACLILKSVKDEKGMPTLQYDTMIYKQNLDFIHNRHRNIQVSMLKNISFMEASNKMIEGGLFGFHANKSEIREKLASLAKDIMQNIKSYDIRISEIECDY
ncbi:MAG: hypothetical protein ACKKMV_03515 [Candidatus Nealsonbacteria bacterium]